MTSEQFKQMGLRILYYLKDGQKFGRLADGQIYIKKSEDIGWNCHNHFGIQIDDESSKWINLDPKEPVFIIDD